jgi:hypothetical protein
MNGSSLALNDLLKNNDFAGNIILSTYFNPDSIKGENNDWGR